MVALTNSDFDDLSTRARKHLTACGICPGTDTQAISMRALRHRRGVGAVTVREVVRMIEERESYAWTPGRLADRHAMAAVAEKVRSALDEIENVAPGRTRQVIGEHLELALRELLRIIQRQPKEK